ncbi:MAG: hypothetical protein MI754_17490 [Chromatiales bacterium]|nr:hypothetical protein [Chromatiales bacterium]
MQTDDQKKLSDYDRLKEINHELSSLAKERKACRSKTSIFGAIAGVLLAVSLITLFQNLLNMNNDWEANINSPVHEVVAQDESSSLFIGLSCLGIVLGLGLFVMARGKCSQAGALNDKERSLVTEMRLLRDKMYVKGEMRDDQRYRPKREEQTTPLAPEEVRGEYVGVYSPPGSKNSVN